MPYKTQNPHLGPSGSVESFDETSWPNDRVQLGYVFEKGAKRWQCFKVVDATASAGDVLFVKNYASYEATPTIGNSASAEVAGVPESAVSAANVYKWLRQGGPVAIKAIAGSKFARGTAVAADTGNNRVVPAGQINLALAAADTAGGVLAWLNPCTGPVLATAVINRTTKSTAASTIDVGAAANGTTSSDTLIDGLDSGAAEANGENPFQNAGTNGKGYNHVAAGAYITASKATGACAGLAGTATINFFKANGEAFKPIGIALGDLGADVQGVTTSATQVAVDLDIKPL
jgi:hypothetical protein